MAYYAIPQQCPACGKRFHIETVGINKEWVLAVNWTCRSCDTIGGTEMELARLVEEAITLDGEDVERM